jgi:hypothetical protein
MAAVIADFESEDIPDTPSLQHDQPFLESHTHSRKN